MPYFRLPNTPAPPVHPAMQHAAEPVTFCQVSGCSACKLSKTPSIEAPLTLYAYAPDVDAIYQHALAAGHISRMVSDNMFRSERCCRREGIDSYRCEISRQQENRSSSQMLTLDR